MNLKQLLTQYLLFIVLTVSIPCFGETVEEGFKKMGEGIKRAAEDTGKAIETGAQKIGSTYKEAGESFAKGITEGDVATSVKKIAAITTAVIEISADLKNTVDKSVQKIPIIEERTKLIEQQAQAIGTPLDVSMLTQKEGKISEKVRFLFEQLRGKIQEALTIAATGFSISDEVTDIVKDSAGIIDKLGSQVIQQFDAQAGSDTKKVADSMTKIANLITTVSETVKTLPQKNPIVLQTIQGYSDTIVTLLVHFEDFIVSMIQQFEQTARLVEGTAQAVVQEGKLP